MNESDYPYSGAVSKWCHLREENATNTIASYEVILQNSTYELKKAIMTAPTTVALASGNTYFRQYKNGILNNLACPVGTDHDALAVGYGEELDPMTNEKVSYAIVKNSWGKEWGESGYIRIAFGVEADFEGICGIKNQPVLPSYLPLNFTAIE